ncbi:hypothetical protein M3Y95_01112900 [Aphelenchoides besseyi]|nr:hypothetical protein M3Y95_01112900 [Aphelenchoides besseyi]
MNPSAFNTCMNCCSIFTLSVQFFVLHCVYQKSSTRIREYKHFLANFLVWDLVYTILLGFFLSPLTASNLVGLIVQGLSSEFYPKFSGRLTIAALIYAASHVIGGQNLCLLYRFIVVVCDKSCHYWFISWRAKLLYFFVSQFVSIALGVFAYNVFIDPEKIPSQLIAHNVHLPDGFNKIENIVMSDIQAPITHYFLITLLSLFAISELISIILIYLILRKLRQHQCSIQSYRLHVQFTIHLAANLALPGILIIVPSAAFAIGALCQEDVTIGVSQLAIFMNAFYATANALLVLLLVQTYRQYTFQTLILPWLKLCIPSLTKKNSLHLTAISYLDNGNSAEAKHRRSLTAV